MAKKTRTELSTLAINTNLPDNTTELITPTTERSQLTDERESVVNYKDDLGGVPNAGKFLTVAVDGESLTMVDEPSGVPDWVTFQTAANNLMMLASGGTSAKIRFYDTDGTTIGATIAWSDGNSKLLIGNSQTLEEISLSGNQINLSLGGAPQIQIVSNLATFAGGVKIAASTALNFGGRGAITQDGSYNFTWSTNGVANGFYLESATGNVGLGGITSPTYRIEANTTSGGNGIKILRGADSMFEEFQSTAGIVSLAASGSNGSFSFRTGTTVGTTTPRLTISSGGLVTVQNGIKFGGTPSPAYDVAATTLDAYEEGTWTPSIAGGFTSVIWQVQQGKYTRVGNMVTAWFYIQFSGTYDGAHFTLGGLPYTVGTYRKGGGITYYNVPLVGSPIPYPNSNSISIYKLNAYGTAMSTTADANFSYFIGSVTYGV